jgi:hypothetical protein
MKLGQTFQQNWSVASRAAAAIIGGYIFIAMLTLAIPLVLASAGIELAQSIFLTIIFGFVLYVAIIMAVFHASSAARAWTYLVIASVPPAVIVAFLLPGAV